MTPHTPETFEVDTQDVEYLNHASGALQMRLYLPRGQGPFPMLVEVHGGAWCRGTRLDQHAFNEALARSGIAIAALDFRMPPDGVYPASMSDINFAVRWLKASAAQWRTRSDMIGLMGASSGAHQALLVAMRPHDNRYAAQPLPEEPGLDARPAFVVACWPVIDPLGRYRYAKALQSSGKAYPEAIDRVIPDHEKYWTNEANMAEGNPVMALERGECVETPPVLYIQGALDIVHPRAHLDRFVAAYRQAGGDVTLRIVDDEAEGFTIKKPDSPAAVQAAREIAAFVRRQVHTES